MREHKLLEQIIDIKMRKIYPFTFINCRLKSYGVGGINKLDSSFEPTNSDSCAIHKSEHDSPPRPRDRVAVLESGLLVRGSNKYVFLIHILSF